jgi:two-component system phosphate regulon sensor histidine kinase PhoR
LPARWVSALTRLALWLGLAVVLGAVFGGLAWWLVGAMALYLVYTLNRLYRLDQVLQGGRRYALAETHGLWAELFAGVDSFKLKAKRRKKKYNRLLREIRESTGALHDAGIILNPEREIVWFNKAAGRLLGLEWTKDIGQRIDNLIRHPDFIAYLDGGDGEPVTIPSPIDSEGRLAVQVIPYGSGQSLTIAQDVTRQTLLERSRRDFVANASHELRSPLTVISGYLDAMAEEAGLQAQWGKPISEMNRQTERMTALVKELIELSRLESSEGDADRELVDVPGLLESLREEYDAPPDSPAVKLELDSDVMLLGDEGALQSVFRNLLGNAVRFTESTGQVVITWRGDRDGAECTVADTGIGIPEEAIPRLTERFFRVDPGRCRSGGGTGLGLAIVKHALQRHGGSLSINSTLGEGSSFTCHFPADRVVHRGG